MSRTACALAIFFLLATVALGQRPIQKPGEIQKPRDTWQKPGEIQVPKGIQAIKAENSNCQQRLTVVADTLFEFNKATLTADAEETLSALGPMIAKAGNHPVTVEGHTDSVGSAQYNQTLSEKRAATVKAWLIDHKYLTAAQTKGFGKTRPVALNTNSDGSDNPEGRQKNRRVEVIIDTCH